MGTLAGGFLNLCYNKDIKADTLPTLGKAYRRGSSASLNFKLLNMRLGPREDPVPKTAKTGPPGGLRHLGVVKAKQKPGVKPGFCFSYPYLRLLNRKSRSKPRASRPEMKFAS